MRLMKKSTRQGANYDNVRRTIYICDIASQVRHAPEPCLCPVSCEQLSRQGLLSRPALKMIDDAQQGEGDIIIVQVTEAEVAQHFANCGQIMDCRVCGDPNSAMRFAFIEFKEEASVMKVAVRIPLLHQSICTVMALPAGWRTPYQEFCCTVGSAAELVPAWQPSPARHALEDGHCTCQE